MFKTVWREPRRKVWLVLVGCFCLGGWLELGEVKARPGFRLDLGRGKRKGLTYHRDLCNKAKISANCAKAGVLLEKKGKKSEAARYYKKACQAAIKPIGSACFLWGLLLNKPQKALKPYLRACRLNDADGCTSAGDIYAKKPATRSKAPPLYRKGCRLQDGRGCHRVGRLFFRQKKFARAAKYMQRSCRLGYAPGCGAAGWYFEFKKKKLRRAERFYLHGCGLRDAVTCGRLGLYYKRRNQRKRALRYLRRSCRLGFPRACRIVRTSRR